MTDQSMRVSRDVIVDLLPLYLAGEASAATRSLIEQYLSRDEALATQVRSHVAEILGSAAGPVDLPPELELRSLSRTRGLLRKQRWLFGTAIGLSVLALTSEISRGENHSTSFHFLIRDYPMVFGPIAVAAIVCWIAYMRAARRLRTRN
jgi:anti-sigma factor RsiW